MWDHGSEASRRIAGLGRPWARALGVVTVLTVTLAAGMAQAEDLTVLVGPVVYNDSLWMADKNGFYKDAGLNVVLRAFPSGSTALQTFAAGQGDIVVSGELPSVSYWAQHGDGFRAVFAISRESKGEVAMSKTGITTPQDLAGKVVATRFGSTGSWFLSEYLASGHVDPSTVHVKNLETSILPTALCSGDIDAFFIWQPFGTRATEICGSKVHQLTDATGYMNAYLVAGARPDWLARPENQRTVQKFISATLKGKAVAEKDFPSVAAYVNEKFGMSKDAARQVWDVLERPVGFDATFYKDYCQLARWMRDTRVLDKDFNFASFLSLDALQAAAPGQLQPAPASCG